MGLTGWMRRRWAATVAASVPFALLVWPSSGPWLRVLGAAAAARVLYCVCAQLRVSSIWASGRVDAKKRAVVITGCDTGFGHATALRLHAAGVGRVFACVLDGSSAGAEALRALSPRVCVIPCDVTDAAAVAAAVDTVRKELFASNCDLWALVNNAGILAVGECEWMRVQDVQKAIDVNVMGQVRTTQAFLPMLRETKGRVVNVNSLASRFVGFVLSPYTMSKYASLAFTESLRREIKRFSVSVHSIEPWIVRNAMGKAFIPLMQNKIDILSGDIKNIYNEEYARKLVALYEAVLTHFSMPESAAELIVDDIEDACLSKYPEDRYVPGNLSKLTDTFSEISYLLQDMLVKFFLK